MVADREPLRTPQEKDQDVLALRPLHILLVLFVMTLPASRTSLASFEAAPRFDALADPFLFTLLLGMVVASVALVIHGLQHGERLGSRTTVVRAAAALYVAGTLGFLVLLFASTAMPLGAVVAGFATGAALPVLLAAWSRLVAATMERALLLCAFVLLCSSFCGWLLTLVPLRLAVPLYALLLVIGTVPVLFHGWTDADLPSAPMPDHAVRALLSVTWLPLLGLMVYAFMTTVLAHSAFGVMRATFLGGTAAAVIVFGVCFLWGKRPLLPWCYRILVPLLAAVFVVLGAFPTDTFPKDLSVVALYLFYLVLAALACALFLAVVQGRELPVGVAVGFGVGMAAAAALVGQILTQVLVVTEDLSPLMTVLTGVFVAVLLVFLGRTAWDELVCADRPSAEGAAADGRDESAGPGVSEDAGTAALDVMRDTLETRCHSVAQQHALSPREEEVLGYLARGFSPTYIAKELVLSVSTVRTHVRNIYRKLGVNKREELIHLIDGV